MADLGRHGAVRADGPPPLGDEHEPLRRCTRLIGHDDEGAEVLCGKPAIIHVDWGEATGFVCSDHRGDLDRWGSLQFHDLGSCCGMPGALWYPQPNVCAYPDGELPVSEPVREVAVPAGALQLPEHLGTNATAAAPARSTPENPTSKEGGTR